MAVTYYGQRIRLAVDVTSAGDAHDIMTGTVPHLWRGCDVRFEIAAFFGDPRLEDTELLDMTNVLSATLSIMPVSRVDDRVMYKTVAAGSISLSLTRENWDNASDQHMIFAFANTETAPDLAGALSKEYFVVLNVTTNDTKKITWGVSRLVIEEDGHNNSATPTPGDPTYYTAAEVDAKLSNNKFGMIYLYNQETGLYHPCQLTGTGDAIGLVVGATGIP
jgi:hypothetical protein